MSRSKSVNFNVKNEDFNNFSRCLYLVTHKIGYIALDNEDIYKAFSDFNEIEFFNASANDPKHMYEELLKNSLQTDTTPGWLSFQFPKLHLTNLSLNAKVFSIN